jgi:hypothetical protein
VTRARDWGGPTGACRPAPVTPDIWTRRSGGGGGNVGWQSGCRHREPNLYVPAAGVSGPCEQGTFTTGHMPGFAANRGVT